MINVVNYLYPLFRLSDGFKILDVIYCMHTCIQFTAKIRLCHNLPECWKNTNVDIRHPDHLISALCFLAYNEFVWAA